MFFLPYYGGEKNTIRPFLTSSYLHRRQNVSNPCVCGLWRPIVIDESLGSSSNVPILGCNKGPTWVLHPGKLPELERCPNSDFLIVVVFGHNEL